MALYLLDYSGNKLTPEPDLFVRGALFSTSRRELAKYILAKFGLPATPHVRRTTLPSVELSPDKWAACVADLLPVVSVAKAAEILQRQLSRHPVKQRSLPGME